MMSFAPPPVTPSRKLPPLFAATVADDACSFVTLCTSTLDAAVVAALDPDDDEDATVDPPHAESATRDQEPARPHRALQQRPPRDAGPRAGIPGSLSCLSTIESPSCIEPAGARDGAAGFGERLTLEAVVIVSRATGLSADARWRGARPLGEPGGGPSVPVFDLAQTAAGASSVAAPAVSVYTNSIVPVRSTRSGPRSGRVRTG